MTKEEVTICKIYLDDLDRTHDCNEYKLLMQLLDREPSEDCVSRQVIDQNIYDYAESNGLSYANMKTAILDVPPVTPIRKKGKWVEERNDYGELTGWHCSNCYDDSGFTTTCKWDYCPNCGAEMESKND